MNSPSPCAAPAATLPHTPPREHIEGDPTIIEDLTRHLEALQRQAAAVSNGTLRACMAVEIGCAKAVLRRFAIVRADLPD